RLPIQSSSDCSRASEPPFILDWKPSGALRAHWCALHVCAVVIVVGAYPLAATLKALIVATVLGHALRRPRSGGRLIRSGDGRWSVPERGFVGLALDARSRHTGWWVHL